MLGDEELDRLASLQAAAWETHRIAAAAALEIETRLKHGAVIQSETWTWDPQLRMVRSKRTAS